MRQVTHTISAYVLIGVLVLMPGGVIQAAEGSIFIEPERGAYVIGETFEVQVYANTDGASVHAAEAELEFDPVGLAVETISKEGSVFGLWPTEPTFSNEEGVIRFAGWSNQAFTSDKALIVTITFKALRSTKSNARFAAGAILANDGRGSNILTSLQSGVYTIEPQRVEAPEAPEPVVVAPEPEPEHVPEQATEVSVENTATSSALIADVEPPRFQDYPYTLAAGERIVIKGRTLPDARVFMWTAHGTKTPTQTMLMSAADGSFTYVSDAGAETGVYRMWAEVQDENGIQSSPSETITFNVQSAGIAAAAASGASLITAMLPLLAIVIIGGLGIGYLMHRHNLAAMRYEQEE